MSSSEALISFESSKSNEAKRVEKKLKQEKILAKAKSNFERAEKLKQEKKERGETTWMLPHLDEKFGKKDKKKKKNKKGKKKKKEKDSEDGSSDEDDENASDDAKAKKKKKKSKKKKSKKKSSSSSDDSASGDDEDEWCEKNSNYKAVKGPMKGPAKMERDDWMARPQRGPAGPPGKDDNVESDDNSGSDGKEDQTSSTSPPASTSSAPNPSDPFADLIPTTSIKDIKLDRNAKRNADREAVKAANEAAAAARELNPYWRTGDGSGMPPEKKDAVKAAVVAFDGGASWIHKAYKRCCEQAEREGKTLEEVAAQRYGSLAKLEEMMRAAGGGGRGGVQGSGPDAERSHFNSDDRDRRRTEGRDWRRKVDDRRDDDMRRVNERDWKSDDSGSRRHDDRDRRDNERERRKYDDRNGRRDDDRDRRDDDRDRRRDDESDRKDDERDRTDDDRERRRDGERDRRRDDDRSRKRNEVGERGRNDFRVETPKFARPGDKSDEKVSSTCNASRFVRPDERTYRDQKCSSPSDKNDEKLCKSSSGSSGPSWKKKSEEQKREEEEEEKRRKEEEEKLWKERETKEKEKADSSSSSESSSSEEEENDVISSSSAPPPPPTAAPLTKAEMNALGAKILKAELRGDTTLAESLKAKLEAGREAAKNVANGRGGGGGGGGAAAAKNSSKPVSLMDAGKDSSSTKKDDQELVLTHTDREGNVWPVQRPADEGAGGKMALKRARKKNERETHGEDGKRTRYFADDDKYSLKDLLQQEKMTSAQDQLNMFNARSALRVNSAAIRGEAEGNDGDFAVDDVFMAKSGGKRANAAANTFSIDKSIFQSKKIKAATENCRFCIENEEKFLKHLMVSVSDKTCLLLPSTTSLVEGHCYIVPLNHVVSVTSVDEDVFEEMQKYRKCLVDMFQADDLDCVFMETVLNLNSHPHAVVECVPLERELGDMAPIYFKKAMMESDVEWAINKRIVELAKIPGNSIRRAVPKGMPYFHVDFGVNAGFAHVIEDESLFKRNFGLEILGGMMDLDPFLWRKPPKEDFAEQMKKCVDFSNKWRPFDWTEN